MGLSAIEHEKIFLGPFDGPLEFSPRFRLIRFPNALPSIFAGLKISITLAVVGAVVGEFVGRPTPVWAYQLMVANGNMNTPLLVRRLCCRSRCLASSCSV